MPARATVELDTSAPVVLIWPSIAAIRSLGRLGVPVFCVDPDGASPATASRYCRGRFAWDLRAAAPERSVEFLGDVAACVGGNPILLAADDFGAIFVAEHGAELSRWYRIQHPPAELARSLSNKEHMFRLCLEHDVPTPGAIFPKSRAAVEAALGDVEFPVLLKGIDTQLQEHRSGKRMVVVHSRRELLDTYDELECRDDPNLMLQEYVPGGAESIWMFNGYFDAHSRCLMGYAGRKLRQWPVGTGATSLGVCVSNAEVESLVTRFMAAVGYRGPLDLGFRYDTRDGRYKLLDVNPRIGATFRLFVGENDVDVVRALHLDLTGRDVPCSSSPDGRKWIDEYADLASSYSQLRQRELGLATWLRSLRGIHERQWLARDDPAPFAAMGVKFGRSALRSAKAGRVRRALRVSGRPAAA